MNPNVPAAYQALQLAQQALRRGDKHTARQYAERAVQLAPELEEVWLLMAALASPRSSVAHLERALKINPKSERARKGMHWAIKRLRAEDGKRPRPAAPQPAARKPPVAALPAAFAQKPLSDISQRKISFPVLLITIACIALFAGVVSGSVTPALAFIRANVVATDAHAPVSGAAEVDKPTYTPTPTDTSTPTATFTSTPTFTPTYTPTPTFTPTNTPTETPTPTDTPTDIPTETPWPTNTPVPVKNNTRSSNAIHWIDVNLSQQMLYAYEGDTLVASFLVSTGTWRTPTVTGQFSIWHKTTIQAMSGPGYYLPNVQWVMYFYKDYGIHGTYWHNNFGTPMSHGCVNMRNADAEWLYYWAPYGTLVNVHY